MPQLLLPSTMLGPWSQKSYLVLLPIWEWGIEPGRPVDDLFAASIGPRPIILDVDTLNFQPTEWLQKQFRRLVGT